MDLFSSLKTRVHRAQTKSISSPSKNLLYARTLPNDINFFPLSSQLIFSSIIGTSRPKLPILNVWKRFYSVFFSRRRSASTNDCLQCDFIVLYRTLLLQPFSEDASVFNFAETPLRSANTALYRIYDRARRKPSGVY